MKEQETLEANGAEVAKDLISNGYKVLFLHLS